MFWIIANQTLIMFLMILVGLLINKTHLSDHRGNKALSEILLMVVTPAMLLNTMFTTEYDPRLLRGFFAALLLGFIVFSLAGVIAQIVIRKNGSNTQGIERYCAVYGNCGFMGIPIVYSVLGSEGVFYLTGLMMAFNVVTWTHGVIQVTGETSVHTVFKGLRSTTVISIIVGIAIFLLRIPVPSQIKDVCGYIGNMNTPLGMFVAGTVLGETHLISALKNKRLYLVCILKLLVIPTVIFAILMGLRAIHFPGLTDAVLLAVLIPTSCPTATNAMMFALRFDKDYKYASQMFIISTLLSMLTIPLFIAAASVIGNLNIAAIV